MSNETALVKQESPVVSLAEIKDTARLFAESGYFQDAKQAAQAFVKIMTGRELGFNPMASMTGVVVIQGKPVIGANLMASKIRMSGYDYRVTELTMERCLIELFDSQKRSLGTSEFTMKEATAAGLTGKDNWKHYPKNMLFARAISNGIRWFCPEIMQGQTVYTPDELGATVDADGNAIVAPSRARMSERRTESTPAEEAQYQDIPPEPAQKNRLETSAPDEETLRMLREIEQWLLTVAGGDEDEFNRLLDECAGFISKKDGSRKTCRNRDDLENASPKWVKNIHHKAREKFEAHNTAAIPETEPITDGLPF
jgi:hypothetical protein